MKYICLLIGLIGGMAFAQKGKVIGYVVSNEDRLPFANVYILGTTMGAITDEDGFFEILDVPYGNYILQVSFTGYKTERLKITVGKNAESYSIILEEDTMLDEVVVSGTMKAVSRMESAVPVEVYSPVFLKKNPVPNIFESLQLVNGVRPQLNCNVCNTGDIHINGLEGPYTMVLIDGMPIVSGLSTVYGLSGIPNSLIEQVEIVKGPASSLYGSEAVGGLINIITRHPDHAPTFFADLNQTSWGELNVDVGTSYSLGDKARGLLGINTYYYNIPIDNNQDNFTDVTLQKRVSLFNKWSFVRHKNRLMNLAARVFYEDRWGGEMQWKKKYRGGSEIYGESIYTARYELLGNYQLPVKGKWLFSFSYTNHDQNSVYGDVKYLAKQQIGFGQLTLDANWEKHDLLMGLALRYQYYNDNTPATFLSADKVWLPGLFLQDEITLSNSQTILIGNRLDYDSRHGFIYTPRLAYRWKPDQETVLRINAGTGFRVVNLFTEEHAALTGSREVVLAEELHPEKSYNLNVNFLKKIYSKNGFVATWDSSAWITYFTNVILPDYDVHPNKIIYANLDGHAISKGISSNLDVMLPFGLKGTLGGTIQDVSSTRNGVKSKQILTEQFSGTWALTYTIQPWKLSVDYTGNLYGPMRLPLLGDLDPRRANSPVWSIQNVQFTWKGIPKIEVYAGVKNLLNWTPNKGNPFLIARAHDPFDKQVLFDNEGKAIPTSDNPYALTFDPGYVFAPNQGIRGFFGLRYTVN
ncbi:TonB-dependent receptor [Imtechella halotolerans]|uniref:TonB-dependent receptor plug n=1 Tax=Imtechella halotolerans K1 TaxID=946077 RepID=I0WJ19_9FLAO|nr:TonB-dependent receptor [Imtechella halotolerans]EID76385.1 TonB-dependent receptor plug [Imtechella halotolerans K1]WMQ63042.1 TonB-dependent receptor [Imtechella halotolerans]